MWTRRFGAKRPVPVEQSAGPGRAFVYRVLQVAKFLHLPCFDIFGDIYIL
jgi:hypothetical protein